MVSQITAFSLLILNHVVREILLKSQLRRHPVLHMYLSAS